MGRYTSSARAWIAVVTAAAIVVAGLSVASLRATPANIAIFTLLGACAAVAHLFPVRMGWGGRSFHVTNALLVPGGLLLPIGLAVVLPLVALSPSSLRARRRPGEAFRWTYNVSQTTLAIAALTVVAHALHVQGANELALLFGACIAGIAFLVVQEMLVTIVIALNTHGSALSALTLDRTGLLSDGLMMAVGVLIARSARSNPELLVLIAPLLAMAYLMARAAHQAAQSRLDPKTGLPNAQQLERTLAVELAQSQRTGRPVAVLFADLDHFKTLNDQYGHVAGDGVLREVASILSAHARAGDTVARFGGEEFVAVLPGCDTDTAMYRAEEIRAAIQDRRFGLDDGTRVGCTVSIGVATGPSDATDPLKLLARADEAMYAAKRTRNQVVSAQALPPVPRVSVPAGTGPAGAAPAPIMGPARSVPSPLAPIVLWAFILGGLTAVCGSLVGVQVGSGGLLGAGGLGLLPFFALAAVAECLEVRLYEIEGDTHSFSFTAAVTLAAVVSHPLGAPLVSMTAAIIHLVIKRPRRLDKALFNLANPALAAAMATGIYHLLTTPTAGVPGATVLAAIAATIAFHTVNTGGVSVMIALHTGRAPGRGVRHAIGFSPTLLLVGLMGAFLGGAYQHLGPLGVALFVAPVLLMRFMLTSQARHARQTMATVELAKAEVERAHATTEDTLRGLIEVVASIIDAREPWVLGHSERVAKYAVAIGEHLGLAPATLAVVQTGALLHDLGKVGIPEGILNKPGRLSPDEYATMKRHAGIGEQILARVPSLQEVARIVGEHHERVDGRGYPRGLQGEQIGLGSRVVAVADALDAILSNRPYSHAESLAYALAELRACAGTQFDLTVVHAAERLAAAVGEAFFADSHVEQPACPISVRHQPPPGSADERPYVVPVTGSRRTTVGDREVKSRQAAFAGGGCALRRT